ncbi:MAG: hypothetical protein ACI9L6_000666 [Flavobacterium sp.]|jgi:hypothetical protein
MIAEMKRFFNKTEMDTDVCFGFIFLHYQFMKDFNMQLFKELIPQSVTAFQFQTFFWVAAGAFNPIKILFNYSKLIDFISLF